MTHLQEEQDRRGRANRKNMRWVGPLVLFHFSHRVLSKTSGRDGKELDLESEVKLTNKIWIDNSWKVMQTSFSEVLWISEHR
jgi:hypothetical protein